MNIHSSNNILAGLAKPNNKKLAVLFTGVAAAIVTAGLAFSSMANAINVTAHTVYPTDIRPISEIETGPSGWYVGGVGDASVTPTTTVPYDGAGSAEFTVNGVDSYVELGLYKHTFASNRLAELPSLSYATWQQVDNTKAVSFEIGIDTNLNDADASWQGRLVFDPYLNADITNSPLTDGQWQTWLVNAPTAQWWMTWSDSLQAKYGPNQCPQENPCTYSEVLARFPNIGFNQDFGNPLVLKAGNGWDAFTGFVDVPAVGTSLDQEYWNFEPATVTEPTYPISKDECKKDGWQNFGTTFKNQGACVSYVARKQ